MEVNACVLTWVTWQNLEWLSEPHYMLYIIPHSLTHIYRSQIWIYGPCTEVRFTPGGKQCTEGREAQRSERPDVTEQRYLLSMVPNHARKRLSSLHATDQPFTYKQANANHSRSTLPWLQHYNWWCVSEVSSVNMQFYLWLCATRISDSPERAGNNGWEIIWP